MHYSHHYIAAQSGLFIEHLIYYVKIAVSRIMNAILETSTIVVLINMHDCVYIEVL